VGFTVAAGIASVLWFETLKAITVLRQGAAAATDRGEAPR
jgi:hypothetical protein